MNPAVPSSGRNAGVDGKFLSIDGSRYLVKGVSYGTFDSGPSRTYLPPIETVSADFAMMARAGVNTVRVYTPPPREVLDEAWRHGLRLMIGLPWAQHVAFLDDARMCRDIRRDVQSHVRALADHPAVLLFAVGNEIPPGIVRWHGRRRIEAFLRALYADGKSSAPDTLFTYVNYPPTEYLDTSVFDICSFNIYLHDRAQFAAYLSRVQHIAGHRPLLISEAGGDSIRLGEEGQAALVGMQLRTGFHQGACGVVLFGWTDEWWRGGRKVDDWAFGLVNEQRRPKPALPAAACLFAIAPFSGERRRWPKVSVVVCAYNAADTLDECLASLERLNYPNYETVLVNDGSTDSTGRIAERYPDVRVLEIPQSGLAAARNAGFLEARGEIIAYTDADVRVDPDWLAFLIQPFLESDVVGAGGPNVVPREDAWLAQCVARAPGSPTHVLLDDLTAEHVPGCNMAFRRDALLAVGGFDPVFVKAGDDVDLCWRLQARGWRIGFAPAALVWHHHRSSTAAYLRQQVGYGEAETWLMHRHPSKFASGRILWAGHIYSPLPIIRSLSGSQIHTGPVGQSAFPSVYRTGAQPLAYLPHSGRWQILATLAVFLGLAGLAAGASQAAVFVAIGAAALGLTIGKCVVHGWRSDVRALAPIGKLDPAASRMLYRGIIALLHFLQPLARVRGRVKGWFHTPFANLRVSWRLWVSVPNLRVASRVRYWLIGRPIQMRFWGPTWVDAQDFCNRLTRHLRTQRFIRAIVVDDGWWEDRDLSIEAGEWLRAEARALVEDHGETGSLCRVTFRAYPRGRAVAVAGVVVAVATLARDVVSGSIMAAGAGFLVTGLALSMTRTWRALRNAAAAAAWELGMVDFDRSDAKVSERAVSTPPVATAPAGAEHANALSQEPVRPATVPATVRTGFGVAHLEPQASAAARFDADRGRGTGIRL
jgi:GT2 family glycosyltransferase